MTKNLADEQEWYEVAVVYRSRRVYNVLASDADEAESKARKLFDIGDSGDNPGDEEMVIKDVQVTKQEDDGHEPG